MGESRGCPDPPDDAPDPVILPGGRLVSRAAGAAEPFANPQPGRIFKFPADHGAHPDFKTEWWYWVGHLKSPAGRGLRLPDHLLPGRPAPARSPGPLGLVPQHRLFRPPGRHRPGPGALPVPGKGGPGRPGAFRRHPRTASRSGSTTGRRGRQVKVFICRPGTRGWGWIWSSLP